MSSLAYKLYISIRTCENVYHITVVERNESTNIAYRVMRIKLGRNGLLVPQLRAGIHHMRVKVIN